MSCITVTLLSACLMLAAGGAAGEESTHKKDGMTKESIATEGMKKDAMGKDCLDTMSMAKNAMAKDAMAKGMDKAKMATAPNAMGKDCPDPMPRAMKLDAMGKDAMKK